jgi:hypothetical protein
MGGLAAIRARIFDCDSMPGSSFTTGAAIDGGCMAELPGAALGFRATPLDAIVHP